MPGIIDQADGGRTARLQPRAVAGKGPLHLFFGAIQHEIDRKADLAERIGHEPGIAGRVGELPSGLLVAGIANDEGVTRRIAAVSQGQRPQHEAQE